MRISGSGSRGGFERRSGQNGSSPALAVSSASAAASHSSPQSLSEAINRATRDVHARLNKLIISRLPLALPPHAASPASYVAALTHIIQVYEAFESAWECVVLTPPLREGRGEEKGDGRGDGMSVTEEIGVHEEKHKQEHDRKRHVLSGSCLRASSTLSPRMNELLTSLFLPGLLRTRALYRDIATLTGWEDEEILAQLRFVASPLSAPSFSRVDKDGDDITNDNISNSCKDDSQDTYHGPGTNWIGSFVSHIRRSFENRPHNIIAYAWVLYMALFSGGRFVRATLEAAGPVFWTRVPDPIAPTMRECRRVSTSANTSKVMTSDTTFSLDKREDPDRVFGQHFCCSSYTDESKPDAEGPTGTTAGSDKKEGDAEDARRCKDGPSARASLTTPGSGHGPQHKQGLPLRFFHFQTARDGEDLKQEFKRRLLAAEPVLTDIERDDIVQEARYIFEFMTQLVLHLDEVCDASAAVPLPAQATTPESAAQGQISNTASAKQERERTASSSKDSDQSTSSATYWTGVSCMELPLGMRIRDSVAVTKERGHVRSLTDEERAAAGYYEDDEDYEDDENDGNDEDDEDDRPASHLHRDEALVNGSVSTGRIPIAKPATLYDGVADNGLQCACSSPVPSSSTADDNNEKSVTMPMGASILTGKEGPVDVVTASSSQDDGPLASALATSLVATDVLASSHHLNGSQPSSDPGKGGRDGDKTVVVVEPE